MNVFEISDYTFTYENGTRALNNISLNIKEGEFVLITGYSGSGKTTLLRSLKKELAKKGTVTGEVKVYSDNVGFIMQNADDQIVTDKVWHELAFGLESVGTDEAAMRRRVAEIVAYFDLEEYMDCDTDTLSGGQKKLLCLAAVLCTNPDVIILDEPTGGLEPGMARDFYNELWRINSELGKTIIVTEHNLSEVMSKCNRIVVLDNGELFCDGSPENVCMNLRSNQRLLREFPTYVRLWDKLSPDTSLPMHIAEGRKMCLAKRDSAHKVIWEEYICNEKENAVEIKEAFFRYDKDSRYILKGLKFSIKKGEIVAILGSNGSGKSTLLKLIAGNEKFCHGKTVLLPQNPETIFAHDTVKECLFDICNDVENVKRISELCRINQLFDIHPYDLSGGEKHRLGLAMVLLCDPKVLLLDEPTTGLDMSFKEQLTVILKEIVKNGVTVLVVSHDLEFVSETADRCALLFDGAITDIESTRSFFMDNSIYTTPVNKMCHDIDKGAITYGDALKLWARKEDTNESDYTFKSSIKVKDKTSEAFDEIKKGGKSKTFVNVINAFVIAVVMPLTIWIGISFLQDKKFLFVALLLLLEAMGLSIFNFEKSEPDSRRIVIIATISALCVAGRAVFYMIPEFKPVVAMVVLSGIVLGPVDAMMIGQITMLVSNIIFGQGPWTPWQMFALGLTGAVSGIIFFRKHSRIAVSVYGFLAAIVIYGLIMNIQAALLAGNCDLGAYITVIVAGLPMDMILAVATVVFIWVLYNPFILKLKRALFC